MLACCTQHEINFVILLMASLTQLFQRTNYKAREWHYHLNHTPDDELSRHHDCQPQYKHQDVLPANKKPSVAIIGRVFVPTNPDTLNAASVE